MLEAVEMHVIAVSGVTAIRSHLSCSETVVCLVPS